MKIKRRPFTQETPGRPWKQWKLYSTTATYLRNQMNKTHWFSLGCWTCVTQIIH